MEINYFWQECNETCHKKVRRYSYHALCYENILFEFSKYICYEQFQIYQFFGFLIFHIYTKILKFRKSRVFWLLHRGFWETKIVSYQTLFALFVSGLIGSYSFDLSKSRVLSNHLKVLYIPIKNMKSYLTYQFIKYIYI